MRYFFYGTLMDPAVLRAVLGRSPGREASQAASLDGYRRVYRRGAWYPVLVEAAGEKVDGILMGGLGREDAQRLEAFEGEDYALAVLAVRTGHREGVAARVFMARVFMARAGVPATAEPWSLADWRRRHRRLYVERVVSTRRPR